METKSNQILVGAIVLALVVALFGFVLWLSRIDDKNAQAFDIFFKQAVTGLAVGSQVQFAGVPVGSIDEIALMPDTPEFVRVRISVRKDVPILQGTLATIQGVGFTGVSIVQLDGAIKGAPPISKRGPFDVPVIPTKPGTLGQLLSTAPQLLERISTLALRLTELLDEKNQHSIAGILQNTEKASAAFARRSDDVAASVAEARVTLRATGIAVERMGKLAETTNSLLNQEGRPMLADLRTTLQRADRTLAGIEGAAAAVRPGIETLSTQTLPEVGLLIRDLRDITSALGAVAAKLDEDPAGALIGGRRLPDYVPPKADPSN